MFSPQKHKQDASGGDVGTKKRKSRSGSSAAEDDDNEESSSSVDRTDESAEVDSSNLLAALRFGWNSVFSMGDGDDQAEEDLTAITDEDVDLLIDR